MVRMISWDIVLNDILKRDTDLTQEGPRLFGVRASFESDQGDLIQRYSSALGLDFQVAEIKKPLRSCIVARSQGFKFGSGERI